MNWEDNVVMKWTGKDCIILDGSKDETIMMPSKMAPRPGKLIIK